MENNFIPLSELEERLLVPGFWAKMVHLEGMTVGHIRVEKGAELPTHFHPHEQITNIISGVFEMTVDGNTRICKAGDVIAIPSNVPHSGKAITDCQLIDAFQPVREDYK